MKRFIHSWQTVSKRRSHRFLSLVLVTLSLAWIMSPLRAATTSPQTLMQQGKQFYQAGQFEQALKSWQAATTAYGDDAIGVTGSLINQGQALSAMGLQRRACKTLVTALQSSKPVNDQICEPLATSKSLILTDPIPTDLQAIGLANLGHVLRVIGNLQAAQTILLQSWQIAPQSLQPEILVNLGNVARDLGNRDRDRKEQLDLPTTSISGTDCFIQQHKATTTTYYQQAIACYQQGVRVSPSSLPGFQARLNHLSLLLDIKQWLDRNDQLEVATRWASATQVAIKDLTAALRSQSAQFSTTYEGLFAQINLARSLVLQSDGQRRVAQGRRHLVASRVPLPDLQQTNVQLAAQLLTDVLEQSKKLGQVSLEAHATGNLGWLYEQVGNLSSAATWTDRALNLASQTQLPDLLHQWQWQKGRILRRQADSKGAIAAYNQAILALRATRDDLIAINPDAQFSLRDSTEPIHRELIDLLLQPENPSQAALKSAVKLVDSLRLAELEDFLQCRLAEVQPTSVEQVNDPTAAIFYPIILRDRIEVILKLPNQPDLVRYRTNLAHRDLNQQIQAFRKQLEDVSTEADFRANAKVIYDWFLKDAEPRLTQANVKTLVFVPDGILRSIPMASLYDGERFLIEKYAIAITPGLEILGPKRVAPRQLTALIAGLGIEQQITVNGQSMTFPALAHIPVEVQQIRATLKQSQVLLDQKFTTQALLAQTRETSYPIVHLATHGQFSSNPDETFILTASEQPLTVDQMQVLLQVRNQRQPVPIEFLVLSACETAAGDRRATLGLAGIALRSGALGTLASLWAVNDASTADLMKQFYQVLTERSLSKVEALRQAQLTLLQDPYYKHPYYWSPFVVLGNWL